MKNVFKFLDKNLPVPIVEFWHKNKPKAWLRKYRNHKARELIISYLEKISSDKRNQEQNAVLSFLYKNKASVFPHDFIKKYNPKTIVVYRNDSSGLPYVMHQNKRLFFKRRMSDKLVRSAYSGLCMEQDIDSPHLYETSKFSVQKGDVVVDAGSAEGIFALNVVERAAKIYLFEVEEDWIEALQATFAPYRDKVVIINKYVSDRTEGNSISLDDYFKDEKINFIKADIEGAEIHLLNGSTNILKRAIRDSLKIVLCTYHQQNDAKTIEEILKNSGFYTEFSKGYMIFVLNIWEKLLPPYLRKGVIRASKLLY
jgi:hypothetical protein